MGWNAGDQTVEQTLAELGSRQLNWARVWACHWDGKNPYYETGSQDPAQMNPAALDRWDSVVAAAEKAEVRFQFVLFHHGLFSSRVNPNWPDHPWNKAKGGFLAKAGDFFTDPTAEKLARNWLRYAVARWGHSPSIMAWELFNEVEWVDAKYENRQAEIGKWHEKMAAHLRRLDPVGRLITTSSELHLPIYRAMDYYQPHGYPPSVEALVLGAKVPRDKPFFFGEVGGASFDPATERQVVRDAAWSGFFAGHSGASQYWYWDRLHQLDLYDELSRAAQFIQLSGLAGRPEARPRPLRVETSTKGPLRIVPGLGWAKTQAMTLKVPEEAQGAGPGRISTYLQGRANRPLFPKPLHLQVTSPQAGQAVIRIGSSARAGAKVIARIVGQDPAKDQVLEFPARSDTGPGGTLTLSYPAGAFSLELANEGADWVTIESITFSGLGKTARAMAVGTRQAALMRVVTSDPSEEVGIQGLGLDDGEWDALAMNLDTGSRRKVKVVLKKGGMRWDPGHNDEAVLLTRGLGW